MAQERADPTIIYYSRSGKSRDVAAALGARMGVEPVEITTSRYTWPILGWVAAGRDGMRAASAPLNQSLALPMLGTVVLVGPVWAGGAASPLNTVIDALAQGTQEVAVLLTCADPKADPAPLSKLQARLGRTLKAQFVLANALQGTPAAEPLLDDFVEVCRCESA